MVARLPRRLEKAFRTSVEAFDAEAFTRLDGARGSLRFAEEIVAQAFVPTWRSLLARELSERGLSQTEVAALLGISQSAVSKHLLGRLGGDARLAEEPRMREVVTRVADGLASKRMSAFEALAEAEALVREFESRGPICRIHEEEMPSIAGLGCDVCVRVGTALVPEQAALQDLRAALRILEATPELAPFLPHVGTNVARALADAKDAASVAAVPGRLFEARGGVKVPAPPEFGVSRHMAEILLAVMRRDPSRLACVNLAPKPELLERARAMGLRVEEVPATVERAPRTLTFAGEGVPDVFHHGGEFGVEPQAYLAGPDATQLALRLQALVRPHP